MYYSHNPKIILDANNEEIFNVQELDMPVYVGAHGPVLGNKRKESIINHLKRRITKKRQFTSLEDIIKASIQWLKHHPHYNYLDR